VVRGVRKRLADLARDLIHRPLALGEHVHDLGAPSVAERLGDGGERVEERVLGLTITHPLKVSLEYLMVNDRRRQTATIHAVRFSARIVEPMAPYLAALRRVSSKAERA